MNSQLVAAATFLIFMGACSALNDDESRQANNPSAPVGEISITPDVVYGRKSGMALTFDVYRPTQGNGAAVIFVVSGGWRSTWDWKQFAEERGGATRMLTQEELEAIEPQPLIAEFSFRPLLSHGFTVFAVRHGSSPKFQMPEIVADLQRAAIHSA